MTPSCSPSALEVAKSWRFDDLNELIAEHNEYYPIERNLPIDPRTGDYVTIVGRSYRREPLGRDWILERFPPALSWPGAGRPQAPRAPALPSAKASGAARLRGSRLRSVPPARARA